MKDIWYADNRDLVKWAILYSLANTFKVKIILQIAFYRPSKFGHIMIGNKKLDIPKEVIAHFRNIKNASGITSKMLIDVFCADFREDRRRNYLQKVKKHLSKQYKSGNLIVFLDSDTGLQPLNKCKAEHVSEEEARELFKTLKRGDIFVFYQHQTNRRGEEWVEPKRSQLADAMGVHKDRIQIAQATGIARDVVIFYTQKIE